MTECPSGVSDGALPDLAEGGIERLDDAVNIACDATLHEPDRATDLARPLRDAGNVLATIAISIRTEIGLTK